MSLADTFESDFLIMRTELERRITAAKFKANTLKTGKTWSWNSRDP